MNKYTRLYLNYTKCGPFFNDYMGEFLVSIYKDSRKINFFIFLILSTISVTISASGYLNHITLTETSIILQNAIFLHVKK